MVFDGGVVWWDAFFDDDRSGFFLFLHRRGVLEGMAVFRNHALLLISVHDCVEFGLKSPDLRQLAFVCALAEEKLIAVDVEEGQGFAHVLLVTGPVYLLEFD